MVLDGQKMGTDGQMYGQRQNYIPSTLSGEGIKKIECITSLKCQPSDTSIQCSAIIYLYIMLCFGSIGMDCVISELCYKETILQRNFSFNSNRW